jgi:hypothetical protein
MIGSITKLFGSIFGIFITILKLPLTLILLPVKLFSSKKDPAAASVKKPKKNKAFFLEETDAKSVAPKPGAASKTAAKPVPAAATAAALNLAKPTITFASASTNDYAKFGSRRRPGANMKSYLDMAKTIKSA